MWTMAGPPNIHQNAQTIQTTILTDFQITTWVPKKKQSGIFFFPLHNLVTDL